MIWPAVQYPHWKASCSMKASCIGWRTPFRSSPSIVMEGVLHDILDLTDPGVQRELGTSVQELTGEWSYVQSTIGKEETQRLGEAAFASEEILGFKYPSAKNTGKGEAYCDLYRSSDRCSTCLDLWQ